MNLQERLRLIDREILNQLIVDLPDQWSAIDLRVERRTGGDTTRWVYEIASPEGHDASGIPVGDGLRTATRSLIELMESQGHRVVRVHLRAWLDEERVWAYRATLDYDM